MFLPGRLTNFVAACGIARSIAFCSSLRRRLWHLWRNSYDCGKNTGDLWSLVSSYPCCVYSCMTLATRWTSWAVGISSEYVILYCWANLREDLTSTLCMCTTGTLHNKISLKSCQFFLHSNREMQNIASPEKSATGCHIANLPTGSNSCHFTAF